MVPNHIFQLITLMSMEPPISFDADSVHDEQTKILRAIQPLNPEQVLTHAVRGQYGDGMIDGKFAPAYRSEPNVAKDSHTETFVAVALHIDNWRWASVRFTCAPANGCDAGHGNRCAFQAATVCSISQTPVEHIPSNELVISIQPNEGISLSFEAKVPGPVVRLGAVDMNFEYGRLFWNGTLYRL